MNRAPDADAPAHDGVRERWETIWDTLQMDAEAETLVIEGGETLVPPALRQSRELGVLVDELPRLTASRKSDGELRVTATLGQGGMGVVYLARQSTIGREVAVKTIREDRRSTSASRELLREAWITGRLEHPNIIPVHSLGVDEHGCPLFVMKRVEGVSWADAIEEPDRLPEIFSREDRLEADLDILDDVCKAVHFANSRHILHRDIKPDNVMLGPFGEVYLVDWGIAVAMVEDENTQLPLASDANQPAGTPGYMAPEMAAGDAHKLGPRTDVYLLGAILHELLVGQVRHLGSDLYSIMFSAYRSEPFDYSAHQDIPEELAELCNRAMHVEPDERFEDAEAFRQALAAFRRHRSSRQIARDLAQTLSELEALSQQDELASEEVTAAHGLFGTCRFGYQQALRIWAENADARQGLRRASMAMLAIEVASGNLVEVEALLVEVDDLDPALLEKIERLRSRKERESKRLEELERMERSMDLSMARRQRGILTFLVGAIWSVGSFGVGFALRANLFELTYQNMIAFSVTVAAAIAVIGGAMRSMVVVNQINLRLMRFLGVIVLTGFLARVMMALLKIEPLAGIAMEVLAYAMITLTMGVLVEPLAIVAGVLYAFAAIAAAIMPQYCWEFFGMGNTLAILILGYRWTCADDEAC